MPARARHKRPSATADLKVVLLGDSGVGKTSLIARFSQKEHSPDGKSSIGTSQAIHQWGNYIISIWDTAGEERYAGLTRTYCRNAGAIILVFDIANRCSLDRISDIYVPLVENADCRSPFLVLAATKLDLATREVTVEDAQKVAERLGARYLETSSMTGQGVTELFEAIFGWFFPRRGTLPRSMTSSSDDFVVVETPPVVARRKKQPRSCCF